MVNGIAEGSPVLSLSIRRVYVASIGIVVGCRAGGDNPIYEASRNITHISVFTDVEILIARSLVFSSTGTFVILYTAFRVFPVRMHAH